MSLRVSLLTPENFDSIENEWNTLLTRSEADTLFLRWEWLHTWWSFFGEGRRLMILAAWDRERLVGLAPLYAETQTPEAARVLRFCSDELSPDYMDFILEKGSEPQILEALWQGLLEQRTMWDIVELNSLRDGSPLLEKAARNRGVFYRKLRALDCPYLRIEGSFEDHYESRQTLQHFDHPKKLTKLGAQGQLSQKTIQSLEEIPGAIDDVFRLHDLRFQGEGRQSNFSSEKAKRFHKSIASTFLKDQRLNLQLLCVGTTAIGAVYAFCYQNKIWMYQSGFDPAWKKWSAGGLALYLAIQKSFQEHYAEYDFLKGPEFYKRLWTDTYHRQWTLVLYNRNFTGLMKYMVDMMKVGARRLRRSCG